MKLDRRKLALGGLILVIGAIAVGVSYQHEIARAVLAIIATALCEFWAVRYLPAERRW